MTTGNWNDARVERLKDLLADGLSASQIAYALGEGLSRNAIIGKLKRLGLPGGGGASDRPKSDAPRLGGKDRIVKLPAESTRRAIMRSALREDEPAPLLDDGQPVTLVTASSKQCRWMPGVEPGDLQICGHPTMPGEPWCAHHAGRVKNAVATANYNKTVTTNHAVPTLKARVLHRA